jgi:hypothetical protein
MDELYVRFFRLAERRIAEKTGKGIVCFISNFSYPRQKTFPSPLDGATRGARAA